MKPGHLGTAHPSGTASPATLLLAALPLDHPGPEDPPLTPAELGRAAAFTAAAARRRFLAGRYAARRFVAEVAGAPLAEVKAEYRCSSCSNVSGLSHGTPHYSISGGPSGFFFSFSRAGNRILAAAFGAAPVGVDAAEVSGFALPSLDGVIATERERRNIQALAAAGRPAARARLWARKEAVLKATGDGLRIPPQQLEAGDLETVRVPTTGAVLRVIDLDAPALGLPKGTLAAAAVPAAGELAPGKLAFRQVRWSQTRFP